MTRIVWTDRSRVESHQRCARLRWLEYHEQGIGIVAAKKPLALCVGGSVHKGLECLLKMAMADVDLTRAEDAAVADAISDFSAHRTRLALDTAELAAQAALDPSSLAAQIEATARDLGLEASDPAVAALHGQQRNAAAEFDDYLWREQAALVEGMVRAYARRRLRPLLEEFEVLEVEREGDWELASWDKWIPGTESGTDTTSLRFMSRPDALLRSRADNSLYLLSYKTAATWDVRKARDAEHDMQGLSEGVEVERRLGEWWVDINHGGPIDPVVGRSKAMVDFLASIPAPPRILGIRYEYMLKGTRYEDKDLTARFGFKCWSQRSHLIRRYVCHSTPSRGKNAAAYNVGDSAWSWDYIQDDGSPSKLSASNWHAESLLDDRSSMTVGQWIDLLDATEMAMSAYDSTIGQEPREQGYKSDAQALGFTVEHPLDAVFPPPLTVYRSDDQLRDWVEQVEAQERRVAEGVAEVKDAEDDGERRHRLNVLFPMSRRACSYPTECAFTKVCYGGDDIRRDPLASGLYRLRTPNHEAEKISTAAAK